jgi:HEAT repeat protein
MKEHFESHDLDPRDEMEELLSQYLDEELDDETTEYVRQQLASDPEWQRALEELQITVQAIRGLPSEATPERELWPDIVEAHGGAPAVVAQGTKRGFWTTPKLLAAGLTALLVPVAGLSMARAFGGHDNEPVHITVEPRAPRAPIVIDVERIAEQARRAAEQAIRAQERALRGQERNRQRSLERNRLQANALEAMIGLLNDEDAEVRVQAAHALGEYESARAVEALGRALLNDPVAEVQKTAAWALGEIESAAAVDFLGAALNNEELTPEVRHMCAWALGEIESAAAVDYLGRALVAGEDTGADQEVRKQAAWALGEIESAAAVQYLARAMNDQRNSSEVRNTSAWALGEIESAAAVEALGLALVNDADPQVQSTAAWALGEIESAAAVGYLLRALRADSPELRKQAAHALGEIESAEALDGLAAALEKETNAEVKQMMIWAIGEIGN